jgi:diguanylate cyclase (GGDEF)-like protein
MLYLTILALLALLLYLRLGARLEKNLIQERKDYESLRLESENIALENKRLQEVNSNLARLAKENTELYEITREICEGLDEENIFNKFRERIKDYIEVEELSFLREGADISHLRSEIIVPLTIRKKNLGYLVARDVAQEDLDKFHILAQQFLLGFKRALLYKKVQELTIVDGLTQVFNRRHFLERLNEEQERSKKFNHAYSFLMIDIDHFKAINDHYGHLVGDAILREVAKAIKENARQVDFIARYGGEEFCVCLTETDKEQAKLAAERFRKSVENKDVKAYDESLKITISIGISVFPQDAKDVQGIIDKADQALYRAKQTGRNKVC